MFEATTQGIVVSVESRYLPEHSEPASERYVFSYTIRIVNQGKETAQLRRRHWHIMHGDGHKEEVEGPGVVGEQPRLEPGTGFEYTSGCVLRTPHGTMHGQYKMQRPDGSFFEAEIPAFSLSAPHALN
ncbi:MAG: Co2+/Mg2+ efflux protein ApaG [Myxococcales bacterium]|nr:Co2+/Mg2+ efflux protein ApaG [Myxococcales bacterium]